MSENYDYSQLRVDGDGRPESQPQDGFFIELNTLLPAMVLDSWHELLRRSLDNAGISNPDQIFASQSDWEFLVLAGRMLYPYVQRLRPDLLAEGKQLQLYDQYGHNILMYFCRSVVAEQDALTLLADVLVPTDQTSPFPGGMATLHADQSRRIHAVRWQPHVQPTPGMIHPAVAQTLVDQIQQDGYLVNWGCELIETDTQVILRYYTAYTDRELMRVGIVLERAVYDIEVEDIPHD